MIMSSESLRASSRQLRMSSQQLREDLGKTREEYLRNVNELLDLMAGQSTLLHQVTRWGLIPP